MNSIINWLEQNQLTCLIKSKCGFDCPGCGIQRAFVELLKGDFKESFLLYPGLIPLLFIVGYTILHLFLKFKKGAHVILYSTFITLLIILISYFIKIFS